MKYYHGTTDVSLEKITDTGVDVSFGSGELGKGFYVGNSMWRAFSWAWMTAREKRCTNYGVLEYDIDEGSLFLLNLRCKNRKSTQNKYQLQKKQRALNFTFGCDAVWAPIVGKNVQNAYQIKFESKKGEAFINSQKYKIIWP